MSAAQAHMLPVADDAEVCDVARHAAEAHLHLVIDRDGKAKLTPFIFPGMQLIMVQDKRAAA